MSVRRFTSLVQLLAAGMLFLMSAQTYAECVPTATPTMTPTNTVTPIPTTTPRATRTPTPLPQLVGQAVIVDGTPTPTPTSCITTTPTPSPTFTPSPLGVDNDGDGVWNEYDKYPSDSRFQGNNGQQTNESFGSSVAYMGDVDDDGYGDYVVGAHLRDVTTSTGVLKDAGGAAIVSGRTGHTLATFDGDEAKDYFGFSVASAGDVDNDGIADIAVGAYLADRIEEGGNVIRDAGTVKVISGAADHNIIYQLWGDQAQEYFGYSVAFVRAPYYYLNSFPALSDYIFGSANLIVGSPGADFVNEDNSVVKDVGKVQVFTGMYGSLNNTFWGDAAGDNLGKSVAGLVDFDYDGSPEIIAGAPLGDSNSLKDSGYARVYSLADQYNCLAAAACAPKKVGHAGFGYVLATLAGERAGDNFGSSVALAGDVNGDETSDVLVGAYRADVTIGESSSLIKDAGSATVFSGYDWSVIHRFAGEKAKDYFGFTVNGVGDVDQDGRSDVAITAYAYDALNPNKPGSTNADAGQMTLFSGRTYLPLFSVEGDAKRDYFGWSLSSGDTNADGVPDVLVGALKDDTCSSEGFLIFDTGSVTVVNTAALLPILD